MRLAVELGRIMQVNIRYFEKVIHYFPLLHIIAIIRITLLAREGRYFIICQECSQDVARNAISVYHGFPRLTLRVI